MPLAGAHFSAGNALAAFAGFLFQTARLTEFHYTGAFAGNPYPGVINGSIWSVPYEFWCYVGVALLLLTRLLRHRTALVCFVRGCLGR